MIPIESIIDAAAAFYGTDADALTSVSRTFRLSRVRHMAMYLCREEGYTLHEIGAAFERDHSTVHHGAKRIDAARRMRNGRKRNETQAELDSIRAALTEG